MKKVIVKEDMCIGCGACVAINPENFDFNEEGLSKVIKEEASVKTVEACEACPVYAIEINEEETSVENETTTEINEEEKNEE